MKVSLGAMLLLMIYLELDSTWLGKILHTNILEDKFKPFVLEFYLKLSNYKIICQKYDNPINNYPQSIIFCIPDAFFNATLNAACSRF